MTLATISGSLQRSVSGDPWHGSSLQKLLSDVTAAEVASRPIAGAHSIAEIVVHIVAWMEEVGSWLEGAPRAMTDERDWPKPGAWPQPLEQLMAAHDRLQQRLAAFPESRLSHVIGGDRDPSAGTGLSFEATLVGVAEHNAYHGGQIALLKRAARARASGRSS
jgi:uncharacterized damage-inducible protein DinB